jgi:hypothetical protein
MGVDFDLYTRTQKDTMVHAMSFAILQCQRAVIRYGHDKEPNPTLYKLIDIFIENGGSLKEADNIARRLQWISEANQDTLQVL